MAIAAPFPAAHLHVVRGTWRPSSSRPLVPATPGVRLTPRGRIAIVLVSSLFLLAVILVSGRISADASSATPAANATGVVVVQGGESLWQIAQQVAPGVDPRETVTLIREMNGLGDTTVVAGQSIVVPVRPDAG